MPVSHLSAVKHHGGISSISQSTNFPETLWKCEMANGRPVARSGPSSSQPNFLTGFSTLFRSTSMPVGWQNTISMNQVVKSKFIHNLPLRKYVGATSVVYADNLRQFDPEISFQIDVDIEDVKENWLKPIELVDIDIIFANEDLLEYNQGVLVANAEATSMMPPVDTGMETTYQEGVYGLQ